jgi:diguanylate cyclase
MAKIEITDKLMKTMTSLRNKTEESNMDALTGLYNRTYYKYYTSKLFGSKQPVTFAIIDIDNFKDINDGFGHNIGDEALTYISNEFKKNARANDIIIRYGGDEFVVFFENSKASEAIHFFERVSANLKKTPLLVDGKTVPLTFSAGMAEHIKFELFEELFDRADKALYNAKEAGRDMTVISK